MRSRRWPPAWSRWLPQTTSAAAQLGWVSCSSPPARPFTSAPGRVPRDALGGDGDARSLVARLRVGTTTLRLSASAAPRGRGDRRGRDLPTAIAQLRELLNPESDDADDRPGMIRDEDRTIPVVAVTGTNGKTTTTRLIAHILRGVGRKVGWTSTVGVFIEGEMVLEGTTPGPAGAWRVLREPGLDVAVLETARAASSCAGWPARATTSA